MVLITKNLLNMIMLFCGLTGPIHIVPNIFLAPSFIICALFLDALVLDLIIDPIASEADPTFEKLTVCVKNITSISQPLIHKYWHNRIMIILQLDESAKLGIKLLFCMAISQLH